MRKPLRILVCEDNLDDFDLLLLELRRCGYEVEPTRVQTAEDMAAALAAQELDFVFSDWSMPQFSAPDALAVLRQTALDLPFVIVSGTVGEEAAVEALRNGAHDFLVKTRLTRLGVVVERELRDAAARRERAKMQEQLMVSDRMASVGILAAGVAHEINNPLAAVIANLDLALGDLDSANLEQLRTTIREEVADARDAAERVRNIVRDLRIFSRSNDERGGPVDVAKVMDSTLRMASNEIRHRAKVVRDYKRCPPVEGTDARLGQVFLNLVINAAQALPEGKADRNEIRVSIARRGDRVRVAVADTGPGVPADVMKRIFSPFVTTKPASIGTGLGLSICHRIVTALGGTITVESPPGSGATFVVMLPIASAAVDGATQPLPLRLAARRGRVLVVDDDAMVARAIQRSLADSHELTTVTSGADALARIRGGVRYDVIICDLMMPEMTGMELHAELLRAAPDQARAIIFLTGGAFTAGAQEFLDNVENQRIEKPFESAYLAAVIDDRMSVGAKDARD